MTQKPRNTFALKNFRGLDKENKLLKVQSYRASDGYNFIIDSETLKTRPSFSLAHNPNFFLETGDYVIDWHLFGEVYIYVTKLHIYIVKGDTIIKENDQRTTSKPIIKSSFTVPFDFEGLKPFFQEEKKCLFIYCLDEIFVFSTIENDDGIISDYVLYRLKEKPTNIFSIDIQKNKFNQFEELPTPYIPTVFLGNNSFEDVNMLSNQSRYKLFANVPTTTLGVTNYSLPTYYNPEKHGDFTEKDIKVTFYKNRYGELDAFPFYLGNHNEDFFGVIANNVIGTYGDLVSTASVVIENTYFPAKEFEYTDSNPIGIVYERLNLNKKTFYDFTIKNTENQTVFEYIMNYITTNKDAIASWTNNKVIKFALQVQNERILRDNQDRDIISKTVIQKIFFIYVQIRKFDNEVTYSTPTTNFNTSVTSNLQEDYPSFPTPTNAVSLNTYTLNNSLPILVPEEDVVTEMVELSKAQLSSIADSIAHDTWVAVQAKLFTTRIVNATERFSVTPDFNLKTNGTEDVFERVLGTMSFYTPLGTTPPYNNPYGVVNYPNFPTFNYDIYSIKTFDPFIVSGNEAFNFGNLSTEMFLIRQTINNYINNSQQVSNDNFNINLGFGIFRFNLVRADFYETNNIDIPNVYTGVEMVHRTCSVVVKVYISPASYEQQTRYSMTYQARILKTDVLAKDTHTSFSLKEDKNLIQLKVKDYFFDYKNEPTIEVLVSFKTNTDYDIIAKSKFGITFGSENRVFLAGNEDFPNVDRFNVSNDLLGLNAKSQTYELSYFPSKNYRVLGGKGAINGYVVATDSQLYVTKENYPNDAKLFIRQRNISEQGQVSYFEYKTNITKSPLNNRCLVRFYNDILVLAKDGLFGIEISQNVLTDERLVKLRSGFINKDLVSAIENYDNSKIFIVENNIYMYIVIGNKLYLADSRYISQNPNSAAENVSYEIIEWKFDNFYITAKTIDDIIYFVEENNNIIYSLQNFNSDEKIKKALFGFQSFNVTSNDTVYKVFTAATFFSFIDTQYLSDYVFRFEDKQKIYLILKANRTTDYSLNSNGKVVTFQNATTAFSNIEVGKKLYFFNTSAQVYKEVTIQSITSTNFELSSTISSLERDVIYERVDNLYINFHYLLSGTRYYSLTNIKPNQATFIESGQAIPYTVKNNIFVANLGPDLTPNNAVAFSGSVIRKTPINLRWVSAITDFGISQMEKTSFKVNLYATKKEEANTIQFGYRTMRRMAGLSAPIDLSNNFNFNEVDYTQFNLASFDTVAISLPMKENNFLYIQFTLNGVGKIEMNAIEVIYKNNRMLKSIG